jgi:putative flippase GtrA
VEPNPAGAPTRRAPAPAPLRRHGAHAARFVIAGGLVALVAFATFRAVLALLPRRAGAPAAAQAVTTLVSMTCSYLINRAWTFRSAAARRPEMARFLATQVGYFALSSLMLEAAITGGGLPAVVSWVGTTAVMTVLNFLVQRYWVFRLR